MPPGVAGPTVDDWIAINHLVPRLVDVLPNGRHPTVRVFLAGGVPEVMLHLRRARTPRHERAHRERRIAGRSIELVGRLGAADGAAATTPAKRTASIPTM